MTQNTETQKERIERLHKQATEQDINERKLAQTEKDLEEIAINIINEHKDKMDKKLEQTGNPQIIMLVNQWLTQDTIRSILAKISGNMNTILPAIKAINDIIEERGLYDEIDDIEDKTDEIKNQIEG